MRSIHLSKSLLASALGGVVLLTGIGAQQATAGQTPMVKAASVTNPFESRFLEMADLIAQSCAPDVSDSAAAAPAAEPSPDTTLPILVDPVPLSSEESCAAQRHQARISRAFSGTGAASYTDLRNRLMKLNYPPARMYRMPDFSGEPRVRLDLRVGAERLALEVTDLGNSVMVEAFGVPKDVKVTEVRLVPQLDAPTLGH
ncbi:hypothetical protein [Streptomyces sp. NPDC058579]|uniref:hypothetical protein n=1 Tax=Streptomyces sp. NPDC058579 TaxID=3346548 RepID=UPI00365AC20D